MKNAVLLTKFVSDNNLKIVAGQNGINRSIYEYELQRVDVEFSGFFEHFECNRIAVIGTKELAYYHSLPEEISRKNVEHMFELQPPCIVFSTRVNVPELFIEMGNKYNVCVFKSNMKTTPSASKLYTYLQDNLAERISVHGTLMDINGMGTLIIGKSGVGKSETSLDLIKRGQQLVADDLVEIVEHEPGNLIGQAPELLKRYMEIRGIGIVDVVTMFGAGAYRERKSVKLVVELENWDKYKNYDRLGLVSEKIKYFNTEITKITIPVLPGRNVALLVESAALNEKLKMMGHFAAMEFVQKVDEKAGNIASEEE
jgi:HPr kinase/phosphorylase